MVDLDGSDIDRIDVFDYTRCSTRKYQTIMTSCVSVFHYRTSAVTGIAVVVDTAAPLLLLTLVACHRDLRWTVMGERKAVMSS
jgi:hypothetical protein